MVKTINLIITLGFVFFLLGALAFAESSSLTNIEALILKEDYPQALRECERILKGRASSAIKSQAEYLLGICLLKEGKFSAARITFENMSGKYPRSKYDEQAGLGIANSYFLEGNYQLASEKYEQFLRNFPQSELAGIARKQLTQCQGASPASEGYFCVQVGCFSKRDNAEKLRRELVDKGFAAFILELATDNLYHVRVGKFSSKSEAESLELRLKAAGYTTKVCP